MVEKIAANAGKGGVERLNLHALIEAKQPIWVRNVSGNVLGEPVYIYLRINPGAGISMDPIPPGEEPICLTDKVPHKYLAENFDLFRLVDKGLLQLVAPEEAEAYYSRYPEKRQVVAQKIKSLIESSESGGVRFKQMIGRTVMRQAEGTAVTSGSFEVSPRVKWLVTAINSDVLSPEGFKVELNAIRDSLTDVDKDYIRSKVVNKDLVRDLR
jgi:hypothetical protein